LRLPGFAFASAISSGTEVAESFRLATSTSWEATSASPDEVAHHVERQRAVDGGLIAWPLVFCRMV
jgi:hypothetical protein